MGAMPYALSRLVAPAIEPVTLSEVKLFMRVTHAEEDAVINAIIGAATERVEHYLRRSCVTQTWRMEFNQAMPCNVALPMMPVQSVLAIKLIARDGAEALIDADRYYLSAGNQAVVMDASLVGHKVQLDYIAGYGDVATDVPQAIRYAIMSTAAFMYEFRGVDGMPQDAKNILFPYRVEGC